MTNSPTSSRGGAPDFHVRVRPAGTADAKTLATANRFVHDLHLAARPDRFKPAAWDELCEWYHAVLARPATRAWLAEHQDSLAGYVLAFAHRRATTTLTVARHWWEIDQIAVVPGLEHRGVGQALLRAVVDAARTEGVVDFEISTWAFNTRARMVFERFGFVPTITRFELKLDTP